MKPLNLLGRRYTRLVVVERAENDSHGSTRWKCRCNCDGKIIIVHASNLQNERTKSCGCLHREIAASMIGERHPNFKHGQSSSLVKASRTYKSWESMIRRCCQPKDKDYPRYGGKGITVCDRWRNSFNDFLTDMGERPVGTTIDRWPNKTGNYEPGNCRWANPQEQADNRRVYKALDNFSDAEIEAEFYKRQNRPNQEAALETASIIGLLEQ